MHVLHLAFEITKNIRIMPSTISKEERHRFADAIIRNLKALRQKPTEVASICPSLSALTNRLVDYASIGNCSAIVDLGPGNGETTRAFLEKMNANARLLAIESNEHFIESLREIADDRLTVRNGDAIELQNHLREAAFSEPDVIVSGIPFSSLRPRDAQSLMKAVHAAIQTGGVFVAYQLRDDVAQFATPLFGRPEKVEWVWKNVPPLRVYRWIKR
jgi:phosphatidylethanolamine/phosphatidyl-N-methylethanolamine N-methyltransferase